MKFSRLFVYALLMIFACSFPVGAQAPKAKSWPKNIRENFEDRSGPGYIYFRQSLDNQMKDLLLHPEEKKKMKERVEEKARKVQEERDEIAARHKDSKKLGCVLKASDVFTYSPMFEQLNSTELLFSAGILTYLFQNDRQIYKSMDKAMETDFWNKNGNTINSFGDGMAAVGLYGLLAVLGGEKNIAVAEVGFESFVYTGLQVIGLKHIIGKSRPSEEYEKIWPSGSDDSFPSGHTATAFSMATVLDRMYNIGWITYPLAGLNGIARIQANTHWLSDVFVGALFGHLGANEIMARRGIINRDTLKRRKPWNDTFYDVNTYLENMVDSCANFDEANPQQDNVGMISTNYSLAHCFSPSSIAQFSSRYQKKTFNTFTWNNVEDTRVLFRLSTRVAGMGILYGEKTFTNINYPDIQYSYFNRARGHRIPDPWNYLEHNSIGGFEGGFLWEFSPAFDAKLSYNSYTDYYDGFEFMNGYANLYCLETGGSFGKKKDLTLRAGYNTGSYDTLFPQYSYNLDGFWARVGKNFSPTCSLNLLYSQEDRKYLGSAYTTNTLARDNWSITGLEFRKDFESDWTTSLKSYQKKLNSTNPGWSYTKLIYSINVTNRF